jgi:hypothetical protein
MNVFKTLLKNPPKSARCSKSNFTLPYNEVSFVGIWRGHDRSLDDNNKSRQTVLRVLLTLYYWRGLKRRYLAKLKQVIDKII